jgi:hypothetical protein
MKPHLASLPVLSKLSSLVETESINPKEHSGAPHRKPLQPTIMVNPYRQLRWPLRINS